MTLDRSKHSGIEDKWLGIGREGVEEGGSDMGSELKCNFLRDEL
jgi:hypothetical protein